MSNAAKIAHFVVNKLPYPVAKLSQDLAKEHGKSAHQWESLISCAFMRKSPPVAHLHKEYVGDVYCVVEGANGGVKGKTGPIPNRAKPLDREQQERQLEKLMWEERVSWQSVHPTASTDHSQLTPTEAWLEARRLGESYEFVPSLWQLLERDAWLYSNKRCRPQDAYGRHKSNKIGGTQFKALHRPALRAGYWEPGNKYDHEGEMS